MPWLSRSLRPPVTDSRMFRLAVNVYAYELMIYRYHLRHDHKNTDVTRFSYNCAQLCTRQHAPKKHAPTGKHHDKDRMDSFECHGWVTMWVCAGSQILFVRFNHALDHVPYFCIDVPDDVRAYVKNNPRLRPNQVSLRQNHYS